MSNIFKLDTTHIPTQTFFKVSRAIQQTINVGYVGWQETKTFFHLSEFSSLAIMKIFYFYKKELSVNNISIYQSNRSTKRNHVYWWRSLQGGGRWEERERSTEWHKTTNTERERKTRHIHTEDLRNQNKTRNQKPSKGRTYWSDFYRDVLEAHKKLIVCDSLR